MILRLRILGRIRVKDMVMGRMRVGDLVSGLGQWEERLLDTWLGTEETGKNQHHRAILGSVVILAALTVLLGAVLQAPALLRDTRAQDSDRHHGDRWSNFGGIF
jgi:hypothetical protein